MRILVLHNRYQQAGGEDVMVRAEKALLEEHGQQVKLLEVSNDVIANPLARLKAAASAIYSLSARRMVQAEVARFRPQVAHVHNFFPLLSPSVYAACREAKVPVVQTLHNYRLACPNALLFRAGRICEDCLGRLFGWPGVVRGCYRGSRAATAAVATMLAVHRLRGTWSRRVDAFIALTDFGRSKLIAAGLPAAKVRVKPNFVADPGAGEGPGEYALFVGRLSPEKGVATIVEAYVQRGLEVPLKVAGDGPLRGVLEARVRAAGLKGAVQFLGWQDRPEVLALMRRARFLLFPSVWYEGFPVTIAEAMACGRPVMASRLGGTPEIVDDGRTGWLLPPGDAPRWAAAIEAAWAEPDEAIRRGQAARGAYEAKYTPEVNYQLLMGIYESVLRRAA